MKEVSLPALLLSMPVSRASGVQIIPKHFSGKVSVKKKLKSKTRNGFTLMELVVAILIVSILASVAVPIMRSRIDSAKWTEAHAAAGTIRTAISSYVVEKTVAEAQANLVGNTLDDGLTQSALAFGAGDLAGTYFVPADYRITGINADGVAEITVVASRGNAPTGSKVLAIDGSWQ